MKIVVTGNMGCGKSTAVQQLRKYLPHYELFDFDAMVHSIYEDESIQKLLIATFGTFDRHLISDIVYADPEKMKQLRAIVDSLASQYTEAAFSQDNVILDVPLYFEYMSHLPVDEVICITCDEAVQRARVKQRNGFTDEQITAILALQLSMTEKARRSTIVIVNNGTVEHLRASVRLAIGRIS